METYTLFRRQFIPISKYRAWDFFSSPENLLLLTPRKLNVVIKDIGHERICEGQIISHKVTVLPFVRIDWETMVTDVSYYEGFTLRQIKGPYTHWSHQHKFSPVAGGIELEDQIEYSLPISSRISRVINSLVVKPELEKVFNYRSKTIEEYFGVPVAFLDALTDVRDNGFEKVGNVQAS